MYTRLKMNSRIQEVIVAVTHIVVDPVISTLAVYIMIVVAHWVASNAYAHLCTHLSWTGLAFSIFTTPMPHCKALLWTMVNGSYVIDQMWLFLSVYVLNLLRKFNIPMKKEQPQVKEE